MALLLIICAAFLFIFIFSVFLFSQDDFLLLRQKITSDFLFNLSFLTFFIGLFFARVFYIAFHYNSKYINPLVFLHLIKHSGLSLEGGVIGAVIFLVIYVTHCGKYFGHILDFFTLSFLYALFFGECIYVLTFTTHFELFITLSVFVHGLLSLLFGFLILPYKRKGILKNGAMGFLILCLFFLISFFLNCFIHRNKFLFAISMEQVMFLVISVVNATLFFKKQNLVFRF